jgi:hypothetical protein
MTVEITDDAKVGQSCTRVGRDMSRLHSECSYWTGSLVLESRKEGTNDGDCWIGLNRLALS